MRYCGWNIIDVAEISKYFVRVLKLYEKTRIKQQPSLHKTRNEQSPIEIRGQTTRKLSQTTEIMTGAHR